MKRPLELAFVALCVVLIALTTLPGCRRERKPAPTPKPDVIEFTSGFDASLVRKANELEAKLEGRLLWEAARKCKNREFASDTEARDWLKERWRKCEKQAAAELEAAEAKALAWPEGWTLDEWLNNAAHVWADEAIAADPSLKGEPL